ncbi:MAG: hypothetical protein ACP5I1_19270, partial [Candidatus Hinthialibacter sp.]
MDRTADGAARFYTWINPDVNIQYQFCVWGLYEDENGASSLIVLSQSGPMGYNLEGGDAINLVSVANPEDLPVGSAMVVDDLFHSEDLSGGSDADPPLERALALKFNPGDEDFYNVHVYGSTDGEMYSFLGQTGADVLYYFRFDENETFPLAEEWSEGPQDGVSYWFRIFALKKEGGGFVRLDAGPVDFSVIPDSAAPVAEVEAYDDEADDAPLTGETDLDRLEDRKIDVRWTY